MQSTPNLDLPLYEMDDMANLDDGYNAAMRKIDAAYQNNENRFPVSSADIEDGGINTVDIANGAITTNLVADAAITPAKLTSEINEEIENGNNANNYLSAMGITSTASAEAVSDKIENSAPYLDELILIGDSWSAPTEGGKYWVSKLGTDTHCTVKNYAAGGTGFVRNLGVSFPQQLTNAIAESEHPERVKYVLVIGGVNDTTVSTFLTDTPPVINAMYDQAMEAFPNAKMIFLYGQGVQTGNVTYALQMMLSLQNQQCKAPNISPIHWWIPLNLFESDRHLTPTGYKHFGNLVARVIDGNPISTISLSSTTNGSDTVNFGQTRQNITWGPDWFTVFMFVNVKNATVPNVIIEGSANVVKNCPIFPTGNTDFFLTCPGKSIIDSTVVSMYPINTNNGGIGFTQNNQPLTPNRNYSASISYTVPIALP